MAVAIGILGLALLLLGGWFYWRKRRSIDRHRRLASADDSELQPQTSQTTGPSSGGTTIRRQSSNATTANVNHRLSTRSIGSIMTLPPYKEVPGETEEVIAREGEREGLDYIVEGPETQEELEARRQEEVAAIYRVQQTRRRELEERAERRRARRAALEAQDYREVARLDRAAALARQRAQNTSTTSVGQDSQASGRSGRSGSDANSLGAVIEGLEPGSGALLAELQQIRSRGRRVSSVTYADIGTQRHDGSRLRAHSIEDDSQPLLDSAATMGRNSADMRSTRSRASSVASNNGNGNNGTGPNRERSRSRASQTGLEEDQRTLSIQLSEDGIPPEPPSYEDDLSVHGPDAPRYEDVVLDGPTLPQTETHPHAEVHEDDTHAWPLQNHRPVPIERHPSGPKPSAIPLSLRTTDFATPSIEVVSATPITSRPVTPLSQTRAV